MPPYFRIADVPGVPVRQGQHRSLFGKRAIVILHRQTLPGGAAAIVKLNVAGIAQGQHAVVIHGTAGVTAIAVILFVRHQRHWLVLPVHQIC